MMMKVGVVDRLLSTGNSDMVHFGTDLQEKCKGNVSYHQPSPHWEL